MRSDFNDFYDMFVTIGTIIDDGGYTDEPSEFTALGTVMGDLQPYNSGRSSQEYGLPAKEYGLVEDISARLFCNDIDKLLEAGRVLKVGDDMYDIKYVERWQIGDMALLHKRPF